MLLWKFVIGRPLLGLMAEAGTPKRAGLPIFAVAEEPAAFALFTCRTELRVPCRKTSGEVLHGDPSGKHAEYDQSGDNTFYNHINASLQVRQSP